jgi:hypothetical protein
MEQRPQLVPGDRARMHGPTSHLDGSIKTIRCLPPEAKKGCSFGGLTVYKGEKVILPDQSDLLFS